MKATIIILFFILIIFSNLYSQGIPYNQEFQVNTWTTEEPIDPEIAGLKNGGFVVCWASDGQDGSQSGIYGQLFDSFGTKRGNEFQINTYTENAQETPSAAGLHDGGFVICWRSDYQDGSESGVFGQIYDAFGAKKGNEFQINAYSSEYQSWPTVAALSVSGFVVCWESYGQDSSQYGIFGQLYDDLGVKIGDEFQVNTYSIDDQQWPSVTGLKDGSLVVCWDSYKQSGSGFGIFGQRFEASGIKQGNEFQVFGSAESYEVYPVVAALTSGGFVVCWESYYQQDNSLLGIFGQLYDDLGIKQGNEFLISIYAFQHLAEPAVAGLPDGRFVVCWKDSGQGISCQIFDADGTKKGSEFQVSTFPYMYGARSSVAALADGRFVICWVGWEQDGGRAAIIGKYFLSEPILHQLQNYSLLEPLNDMTLNTTNPTFQWQQPSLIRECYPWELTFNLYIDTDSNFPNSKIIKNIDDTTYTIDSLSAGKTYFWKVLAKNLAGDSLWSKQQDWGFFIKPGATLVETAEKNLPIDFELFQNYPNPFNSSTTISYSLPPGKSTYPVTLKIYNIKGRLVNTLVDQNQAAGMYSVSWDGRNLNRNGVATGIYFCTLQVENFTVKIKMLLLR